MKPIDIMVLGIAAVILALAMWYIYKAKKKGVQCIGCPDSKTCSGHCAGCSGNCSSCGGSASNSKQV